MTKPKMLLTTVPFAGFYYTSHDQELDWTLENMFADESGNQFDNGALEMLVFDKVKWGDVQREYAKAYCENVAAEFGITMEFESMTSPREYSFTTDRIFAHIPTKEVRRLFKETPREIFDEVCKERFTSRSGFISSYPSDWGTWPIIPEWDHNHVGTLVAAFIRWKNDGEDMDQNKEFDLMDNDRSNGEFDNWIDASTKGIQRFYKVHEYLRKRQERGEPQRAGLRFLGA